MTKIKQQRVMCAECGKREGKYYLDPFGKLCHRCYRSTGGITEAEISAMDKWGEYEQLDDRPLLEED